MHIYLALAALTLVQFLHLHSTSGAPLTTTPISPISSPETKSQRSVDDALTLLSSFFNDNSTAPRLLSNTRSPPSQPNTTLIFPQGFISYHVPGTPTTLHFHAFGPTVPAAPLLQCLSVSLTTVLGMTLDGKGRYLIENGFFIHKHVLPDDNKITIIVADFRESGRPMDYFELRDTLTGIGAFLTEPEAKVTTLSYEIDVDGKGYVGTGHVDYGPFGRNA